MFAPGIQIQLPNPFLMNTIYLFFNKFCESIRTENEEQFESYTLTYLLSLESM